MAEQEERKRQLAAIKNTRDIDRAAEAAVSAGLSWEEAYKVMRRLIYASPKAGIATSIPGALAGQVEEKWSHGS